MAHDHGHEHHHHDHGHDHAGPHIHPVTRNLTVAFWLNAVFTVIEIIGGILTNSVAILSDAVHDLGDTLAIGSSLYLEKLSHRKRNHTYTYGYRRLSPLAALISSLVLLIGSVIIMYETIPRFSEPREVDAGGMLWLSVAGILFNGLAVFRLNSGGNSVNQRAVMLHLLEDVLGWIAVLIGSLVMKYTGYYWIDPLLSVAIAAFILFNVFRNLRQVVRIFLQSAPQEIDSGKLQQKLMAIPGVRRIHDLHTWTLDGSYHILSMHLVIADGTPQADIIRIKEAAYHVTQDHGIEHPTVEVEFESEQCSSRCLEV